MEGTAAAVSKSESQRYQVRMLFSPFPPAYCGILPDDAQLQEIDLGKNES